MSAALDLVAHGLRSMVAGLEQLRAGEEWVDQNHSPIGKRAHLDACRRGDLVAREVGHLRLVKRSELDAYIEKHRAKIIKAAPATTTDPEVEQEQRINALMTAEPKRRRRRA